jgi:hypothetical protein
MAPWSRPSRVQVCVRACVAACGLASMPACGSLEPCADLRATLRGQILRPPPPSGSFGSALSRMGYLWERNETSWDHLPSAHSLNGPTGPEGLENAAPLGFLAECRIPPAQRVLARHARRLDESVRRRVNRSPLLAVGLKISNQSPRHSRHGRAAPAPGPASASARLHLRKKLQRSPRSPLARRAGHHPLFGGSAPEPGPRSVASGAHALQLALALLSRVRQRQLGQLSRSFGKVVLYEHPFGVEDAYGKYRPSIELGGGRAAMPE